MAATKIVPGAKRKQVKRKKAVQRRPDATQQLHELIRRGTELRDSGQGTTAAKLMGRVEKLQKALQAMEKALKRPGAMATRRK
jgi:hypothetical protein